MLHAPVLGAQFPMAIQLGSFSVPAPKHSYSSAFKNKNIRLMRLSICDIAKQVLIPSRL